MNTFASSIKNRLGPMIDRKFVALCFDDYGNIRLASKEAKAQLERQGLRAANLFDEYDCLETTDDLSALLEALSSVSDSNGGNAKLTALACPCNVSFDKMRASAFEIYEYELLPSTYSRLGNRYAGATTIWRQAQEAGLVRPEFHGREHVNIRALMRKLKEKSPDIRANIEADSLAMLSNVPGSSTSWTAALGSNDPQEIREYRSIIKDGLNCFKSVFGRIPTVFNSPGGNVSPTLHSFLRDVGFRVIESPFFQWTQGPLGIPIPRFNRTRRATPRHPAYTLRNCVFEPTFSRSYDWVDFALIQVRDAFERRKPAIISSHRLNFCGGISEENRKNGIDCLRRLLRSITHMWPDVEFVFLDDLAERMGLISRE
jgi:hypothetical protein